MIDVLKLRKGAAITLKDGRTAIVRGCYMSTEGIVVMANTGNPTCDQNIPLEDIEEVTSGK